MVYDVEWWEENNDISTDKYDTIRASSKAEAILKIQTTNPLARKIKAYEKY
jgi:hypothetical protein